MSGTASGFIMPPSCTSTARSASKPRGPQGRRPLRPARGLGVVSDQYVPVQNRQAFGFLDAVVADGGLRYHTAELPGKGREDIPARQTPRIHPGQELGRPRGQVPPALERHDGSAAPRVFFTPIRVVCQNTLSMAERRGRGQGASIMALQGQSGKPRSWRPSRSSVWPGAFSTTRPPSSIVLPAIPRHRPSSPPTSAN